MARFKKRPVTVEAYQIDDQCDIPAWALNRVRTLPKGTMVVLTMEGSMVAQPGDWLIHGVEGEVYPCKASVFEATYELVAEES